jgi:hypothetical protein
MISFLDTAFTLRTNIWPTVNSLFRGLFEQYIGMLLLLAPAITEVHAQTRSLISSS